MTSAKAPNPRVPDSEWEDARDLMIQAMSVFGRWEGRIRGLVAHLPEPEYEEGSDAPLNLSAAVQGTLESLLNDELPTARETLRRTVAWLEDPDSWHPDQEPH